jgi:hypothetical protein
LTLVAATELRLIWSVRRSSVTWSVICCSFAGVPLRV